jgi:hypothetical protein
MVTIASFELAQQFSFRVISYLSNTAAPIVKSLYLYNNLHFHDEEMSVVRRAYELDLVYRASSVGLWTDEARRHDNRLEVANFVIGVIGWWLATKAKIGSHRRRQ